MGNESTKKFENFIRSFGATRLLLQRAHDNGFLIEGLVLYALLADAFCRICLVLKEQIEKKTDKINEKYIYQHDDKSYIGEREIYKIAFEKKIIGSKLFKELNTLYNIRNKAVHRFFVSEIEYTHLEVVCNRYELVYKELWDITYNLESEQIRKGVGMTILGKHAETDEFEIRKDVYKKIKSGSERTLAKTLGCLSVEEIIEFGSKNGFFRKCKRCNHLKIEHFDTKMFELNKSKGRKLDDYFGSCNSKGCLCEKYEDAKDKII